MDTNTNTNPFTIPATEVDLSKVVANAHLSVSQNWLAKKAGLEGHNGSTITVTYATLGLIIGELNTTVAATFDETNRKAQTKIAKSIINRCQKALDEQTSGLSNAREVAIAEARRVANSLPAREDIKIDITYEARNRGEILCVTASVDYYNTCSVNVESRFEFDEDGQPVVTWATDRGGSVHQSAKHNTFEEAVAFARDHATRMMNDILDRWYINKVLATLALADAGVKKEGN